MFKEIAAFIINYSGISFFITNIYIRNKVTILVYHDPKPDIFSKHLNYLSKRYNFITLNLLTEAIYTKNWKIIPPKSMIITFDDGHKGNFKLLELFKQYRVIPTIYICSQIVDTNRHYWFSVKGIISHKFKKYQNNERLRLLYEATGFRPTKEYREEQRKALNKNEMILMKDFVDFQSHSRFHAVLTNCTDDECKEEIFQSRKDIEHLIGKACKHFSYPNGDYAEREIKLLKKSGYLSARSIDVGWNDLNTNPYNLKIIGIADDASINWLSAQLSGITGFLKHILSARQVKIMMFIKK